MQCDKDDKDPTSRCSPCKERGLDCGQRTLPDNRMENLCANIKKNHLKDILKWMTGLDEKDRELLRVQLPRFEAERLFVAWNRDSRMHSNSSGETRDVWKRYFKFFYCWLMSFF